MPVWDVAALSPRDQFGYWREVICEAFVPLSPRAAPGTLGFASRVEVRPIGGVNCATISSKAQHTAHGPDEVRRTDGAYYFLNLQLAGVCRMRQGGREVTVLPGQVAIVDTTEPYWFEFPQDWRMVSFRVPRDGLALRLPDPRQAPGLVLDATAGPGRTVAALMHTLWELGGADVSAGSARLWEESFVAAAAAVVGGEAAHGPALRLAVERHVRANLQDRTLSVRTVAARFGVSPRTLHAAFAGADDSFGVMVRRARLRRCAELLADPASGGSIAEIGARYGWVDAAAFGRAFRREFGISPGEVRRTRA